ncbi:unnamed protein product [Brachionus calyciflorus]|uniref:J domain-containing protein n=1 Tax=Brachionus calyciflorus TaxID=104777 RepID=A0A813WF74_9BILA|nr:unnamed protein product [Brachionus calyciflorus]
MARVAQSKKKSISKTSPKSKKEKADLKESSAEESHDENEQEDESPKSSFIDECKHAFGTDDLYAVLNLEKEKANANDIKRAYYKLSLKYHPDKVTDDSKKHDAKEKFQVLGKIYSVLSDEEKKKIYDETGSVDGGDEFFGADIKDWEGHWRKMFKKVTTDDVDKFFENYRNSDEERADLLKFFEKYQGDMDLILQEMFSSDSLEDEPRFKEIINEAIKKGDAEEYEKFINDNKKKATKRKAKFEKEAEEAEKVRKEMGIDESQDSLRKAILARREKESNNFLDHLADKYSKKAKNGKTPRKEDEESEAEEATEDEIESEEDSDEEIDTKHKSKKKSPKNKKSVKGNVKLSNKGKVIQKKVKRL